MKIREVPFTLKDGREALLRGPKAEDAQDVLDLLQKCAEESEFLVRAPEEGGRYTLEKEIAFLQHKAESANDAFIVCVADGKVVGNCELAFNDRIKTRHRAVIGIQILKDYWNQGIGTRMFEEMIRIAKEREGVMQMELEFAEGNARGRALYEKMGFRIVGMHPNALKQKDGKLYNEYLMIREV